MWGLLINLIFLLNSYRFKIWRDHLSSIVIWTKLTLNTGYVESNYHSIFHVLNRFGLNNLSCSTGQVINCCYVHTFFFDICLYLLFSQTYSAIFSTSITNTPLEYKFIFISQIKPVVYVCVCVCVCVCVRARSVYSTVHVHKLSRYPNITLQKC